VSPAASSRGRSRPRPTSTRRSSSTPSRSPAAASGDPVYAKPLPRGGVGGPPVWDAPARLRTVETRRPPDDALPADGKTHNYLSSVLARVELRGTDADEALVRDGSGAVACAATSNVFVVDDGRLHTPALDGPVLPGVTRSVVLDLAAEAGYDVVEERLEPAAVRAADEAFLTNSTWEVRPVARVDGVAVGGGPVTRTLAERFDERVEGLY